MGVIAGLNGDIWCSASPSIALAAAEQATDSGDHTNYTMSTHRYWDKIVPVVVQTAATLGGTYSTVTNYTFRYVGGVIQFTAPNANTFVRVLTGNYYNVTQLGDCNDWELTIGGDVVDTTVFQSAWKTKTTTTKQATGKLTSFRTDDRLAKELNNRMIFSLYALESAGVRWECYGFLTSITPKSTATGVITQDAAFDVDGDVFLYLAP